MSNVVYLSTHPRFPVNRSDADELKLKPSYDHGSRLQGQEDVLRALRQESSALMDDAFRARALGQESVGKQKEEVAKYLLSLVATLPTKLRAQ